MTAMETKPDRRVAPWTDFAGNPIREGDTIRHPGGEIGRVVFRPDGDTAHARWKVDYSDGGPLSSLGLQIGDKGQAVVQQDDANVDTPRDEDTLGWHALNYRTADTAQAQEMYEQLEAFVQAQIAAAVQAERERCGKTHKWVPVEQVQIISEVDYCVGRGDQCVPDIGGFWPDKFGGPGWECMGDEWTRPEESPVKFILNGVPLPHFDL